MPILTESARYVLLFFAAILLPLAAAAEPVLSVVPASVSVQTNVGTNAPSQSVQVRKSGAGPLKWTVVPSAAAWLTVSPTSGTNNTTLTLTFQTSGLATQAQPYTTSLRVVSGTQSVTVNVDVTIVGSTPPPPPPQLTITCPANMSVASPDGAAVVVTYTASTSGGVAPVTVTGSPASGSSFPVGTTSVQVTAQSSDGQTASCSFSVTVTYSSSSSLWTFCAYENQFCTFSDTRQVRYGAGGAYFYQTLTGGTPCTNTVFGDPLPGALKLCHFSTPVTVSGVGPKTSITCPDGAINIFPGDNIQNIVDLYPGNTTFCLRAGTHSIFSSITPKSGNVFIGEYGAIVDGTGWTTTNDTDAAFRTLTEDIDYVTIRNLVIRNLRRGIHAGWPSLMPDHWTIEYNEIGDNYSGIQFPSYSTIRNNYIHDNTYSGYIGNYAHNSILNNNEISYNGWEQKVALSANVTFRDNFVHHNNGAGIWFDSDNTGALVEGNRVEDNGWMGIFYEISESGVIRNNIIRRSGEAGVMLSTSKNTQIYNNTLENNFRGITYFLNCGSVGQGSISHDLLNNSAHHNTITVGLQSGAWANNFSYTSNCTSTQVEPYRNGSMNLTFSNNAYDVPSPATGQYWYWDGLKTWSEWQALGHDTTGTVQ